MTVFRLGKRKTIDLATFVSGGSCAVPFLVSKFVTAKMAWLVSADTLNKLSTLMGKWESAKIPGTRDLLSLTVVLIVQSGSVDLRFLSQILDIASGASEFSAALLPAVPSAAGVVLDNVLLEMQQRVFAGAAEIPLLSALEARLGDLCSWLRHTRCGPRTMWLWNALSLICVHRKEKTALTVLSHLLGRIRGSTELLFFQAALLSGQDLLAQEAMVWCVRTATTTNGDPD
ncbi:hypothetical protein HPB51_018585 [Rhipicephalus microplus]|uniref:Integrator complex subunit 5 C-terminal domain-containing protein n=1 Tax=Rhipicephalus microplus TaxID=6941 RepID=A0A9J6ENX1_RHIMP|nr:hypothetical protein HPB51_018585 [Rhipicephalus microplus]